MKKRTKRKLLSGLMVLSVILCSMPGSISASEVRIDPLGQAALKAAEEAGVQGSSDAAEKVSGKAPAADMEVSVKSTTAGSDQEAALAEDAAVSSGKD